MSVAISLARHKYKLILVSGLGTGVAALSALYVTSGEKEEDTESSLSGLGVADLTAGEGIQSSEKVGEITNTKDAADQADQDDASDSEDLQNKLSDVLSKIAEAGDTDSDDDIEEDGDDTVDPSGLPRGGCDPTTQGCSFYRFWREWTIDKGDLTKWKEHILKNVVKFGHWSNMEESQKQQISDVFQHVWPKSKNPREGRIKAFMYTCYRQLSEPAKYSRSKEDVVRDVGKWCLSTPANITTKTNQQASTQPQS